jgi:DNA repair protein RecN (Recombination protein N)
MICRLCIRDFAVIDELDVEFGSGLNLLTGETGAGKSVIVDAISIALGERADTETVRSGHDRAIVEAVLEVGNSPEALRILADAGLSPEDGSIIVSREVSRTGKSQCRISGRPVAVSLLKEITDRLVDTHGQHEHQFLLRADRHLEVLDAWCGQEVLSLRDRVADGYSELRRLKGELQQLQNDERDRARNIDLYQFQIQEIANSRLTPGEEEELLADRTRLANAEKLHAAASAAFELLGEGDRCSADTLGEAVMALQGLAEVDTQLQPMIESLQAALYQVQDGARELRAYRDGIEFNPDRLQEINERLDLIRTLKKKYGETIEEVIGYGDELRDKLELLTHSEERTGELQAEIESLEAKVMADAKQLSALRLKGGSAFVKSVVKELASLGMPSAVLEVSRRAHELDSSGIDSMEFLVSANPGEPPRPLARIASGGEISRIMLAIKSVMAAVDSMPTLIFDEIDVGVGGRTAAVIGDKLNSLAQNSQVLCVTHLPQIACSPGRHFAIEKQSHEGRTVVRVRELSDEERVTELARMLGGAAPSDTAIQHAREMLGEMRDA